MRWDEDLLVLACTYLGVFIESGGTVGWWDGGVGDWWIKGVKSIAHIIEGVNPWAEGSMLEYDFPVLSQ